VTNIQGVTTIKGVAFNQVNTVKGQSVYTSIIYNDQLLHMYVSKHSVVNIKEITLVHIHTLLNTFINFMKDSIRSSYDKCSTTGSVSSRNLLSESNATMVCNVMWSHIYHSLKFVSKVFLYSVNSINFT